VTLEMTIISEPKTLLSPGPEAPGGCCSKKAQTMPAEPTGGCCGSDTSCHCAENGGCGECGDGCCGNGAGKTDTKPAFDYMKNSDYTGCTFDSVNRQKFHDEMQTLYTETLTKSKANDLPMGGPDGMLTVILDGVMYDLSHGLLYPKSKTPTSVNPGNSLESSKRGPGQIYTTKVEDSDQRKIPGISHFRNTEDLKEILNFNRIDIDVSEFFDENNCSSLNCYLQKKEKNTNNSSSTSRRMPEDGGKTKDEFCRDGGHKDSDLESVVEKKKRKC
jgi:hypothetical protein